jgi:hypothetical protein
MKAYLKRICARRLESQIIVWKEMTVSRFSAGASGHTCSMTGARWTVWRNQDCILLQVCGRWPAKFWSPEGFDSLLKHDVPPVCGISYVWYVWHFASKGNYKLFCKPKPSIDKSEYTHYLCLLQSRTIQIPVYSTQKIVYIKYASQNRQSSMQH